MIDTLAKKKSFSILSLVILLCFPTLVFSASPLILKTHTQKYSLGAHLEILEDPTAQWTFDEITSPELNQKFRRSQEESPNYGFTASAYWVRIQLKNALKTQKEWLLEIDYPLIDGIKYFESSGFSDTGWIRKESGDLLPFQSRDVAHRNVVFRLTLRPQEVKTIYLRLTTEGSMQFPITLWDPISFAEMVNKAQYGFGLYYGIFLSMALYNLFIFFSVRDKTYLHYVAFIVCIGFSQMTLNGLAFQFIWPDWPWWANRSVPIFMKTAVLFGLYTTKHFLGLKENAPRINQVFLILMACVLVVMPLSLFSSYSLSTQIGAISAVIASFFVVIVGIFNIRQGHPRYFFIAWLVFLIGVSATALKNFSLLPRTFFTEFGMQIGSAVGVILLSFALAARMNQMKAEKEKALRLQLAASQKVATLSSLFKKFVPPQFIKRISQEGIESIALGNVESGCLTILFSDIRSFTHLSETMTPEETFRFLNAYMARMEAPIQAHGGFVDKFIGDAIMALFDLNSDQKNADSSIRAAIAMQEAIKLYNRHRANIPYAPIAAGIGIHSGEVMIGTLGSSDRMDSTAIGNTVNIASRIEGMTKTYGASILISDTTLRHLNEPSRYATRMIDRVALKGSAKPVGIFEMFDGDADEIKEKKLQTQAHFEEAVSLYSRKAFKEVIKIMKENLLIFPADRAASAYIVRSQEKLQSQEG